VNGSSNAVADLAERLEGVLEELTDMALERRILKARRALERCIAALREESGAGRERLDDGAG
jgi:hypothetical protein